MGRVREEISHGTEVCCSCVDPEVTDAAPGWDVWNELTELAEKETSMAFEELKQKQSVIWGTGPYQNITETITDIHELVIERLDSKPGVRWLDLACGTGAVAERAAQAGADVTGVDLAPVLIETA